MRHDKFEISIIYKATFPIILIATSTIFFSYHNTRGRGNEKTHSRKKVMRA